MTKKKKRMVVPVVQVENVIQREVYRIYASDRERELRTNLLRIDNGTLYVVCADVDATSCDDERYIYGVLFRGWHVLEGSTTERFKLYYVDLEPEQLHYGQLRNGEITVTDLVQAKHYDAFELIERIAKVSDNI